jgi:hypothetical protein
LLDVLLEDPILPYVENGRFEAMIS